MILEGRILQAQSQSMLICATVISFSFIFHDLLFFSSSSGPLPRCSPAARSLRTGAAASRAAAGANEGAPTFRGGMAMDGTMTRWKWYELVIPTEAVRKGAKKIKKKTLGLKTT